MKIDSNTDLIYNKKSIIILFSIIIFLNILCFVFNNIIYPSFIHNNKIIINVIFLIIILYFLSLTFYIINKKKIANNDDVFFNESIDVIDNKDTLEFNLKTKIFSDKILSKINSNAYPKSIITSVLHELSVPLEITHAVAFLYDINKKTFNPIVTYATLFDEVNDFKEGEGLNGQVALNKKTLIIDNIEILKISVFSGLGKSTPRNLAIFPLIFEEKTIAILELSSFIKFNHHDIIEIEFLLTEVGKVLNESLVTNGLITKT